MKTNRQVVHGPWSGEGRRHEHAFAARSADARTGRIENAARQAGSRAASQAWHPVGGGFTLIELLVVVAIIVLLVGILVPSLGMANQMAKASQTQALMSHLSSNIEAYYTRFHAYPGPLGVAGTVAPGGGGYKISGAQNMMLGLTYSMVTSSTMYPILAAGNNPSSWYVNSTGSPVAGQQPQITGPIDYASMKPDGSYEQLGPFFDPGPRQIYDFYPANQFINNLRVPVATDAFSDGLPILYYRRTVGSENPVAVYDPSKPTPGYYFDENKDYTNPTKTDSSFPNARYLIASSGVKCYQNCTAPDLSVRSFGPGDLNKLVSVDGTTNGRVRGGYVLISAGIDRVYGTLTINNKTRPSDDIVVVGGE